jgi:hypothetical protein
MADDSPKVRGLYRFAVDGANLVNSAANVETLRRLWLDRTWIHGESIGPGDPGDFVYGAWHVSCHLAGAGGVCQAEDGRLLWLEVSHNAMRDHYFASISWNCALGSATVPIDSAEGRELLAGSTVLGFVEGNSVGRTSARAVQDSPADFNLWRRQDFDQPVTSDADGGKVWEHWCTLRDIRPPARIGTSVLAAYVSLVAALGDQFPAAVCRGRRDYGHPTQLCALVCGGFISEKAAEWNTTPVAVPTSVEPEFNSADPIGAALACASLDWGTMPRYYMFKRRIKNWSKADLVRRDLTEFRKTNGI